MRVWEKLVIADYSFDFKQAIILFLFKMKIVHEVHKVK